MQRLVSSLGYFFSYPFLSLLLFSLVLVFRSPPNRDADHVSGSGSRSNSGNPKFRIKEERKKKKKPGNEKSSSPPPLLPSSSQGSFSSTRRLISPATPFFSAAETYITPLPPQAAISPATMCVHFRTRGCIIMRTCCSAED